MLLEVQDLRVAIGQSEILRGVDLELRRGEQAWIIGPNGAGKSTLLRALLRLVPAEGDIRLSGTSARELSRRELARHLAYVPQQSPLGIPFSVREFVEMARYPQGGFYGKHGLAEPVVDESLELCRVSKLAERTVATLSGGERQRVLLAAALAQEPELLLLDEPAAFLDPKGQIELSAALAGIRRERRLSILIVTHDVNRILRSRDRVIGLAAGRKRFDVEVDALLCGELLAELYGVSFVKVENSGGPTLVIPREQGEL